MQIGAFSISLSVKNIHDSKSFYEKLGFSVMGGNIEHNWLIMKNGDAIIGLFQGMFDGNLITFNPGWNQNAENTETYTDIREIQKHLIEDGIKLTAATDPEKNGPGHISLTDPDGNNILIDQHR